MTLMLLNMALAATLAALVGLTAERLCARRAVAVRHAVLLACMAVIAAAPLLAGIGQVGGIGVLRVWPTTARTAEHQLPPDLSRPSPIAVAQTTMHVNAARRDIEPAPRRGLLRMSAVSFPLIAGVLMGVWTAGTLFHLFRLLQNVRMLRRLSSTALPAGPDVRRLAARATRQVGLRRMPELSWCTAAPSPLMMGLIRARVLLPRSAAALSADELEAVLLHELAHVARRDQWAGLASALVHALFWWCLPVGMLIRRLGDLRERLCDAHVVASQGHGLNLATALLSVCEGAMRGRPQYAAAAALGAAGSSGSALRIRIQTLTDKEDPPMTHPSFSSRLAVGALGLLIAGGVTLVNVRTAGALPMTTVGGALATALRALPTPDFWQTEGALFSHKLDGEAADRLQKIADDANERPEIRLRAFKLLCDHQGHSRSNPQLSEADNARAVRTAFEYLEAHLADQDVARYAAQRGFTHLTVSSDGNAFWVLIETVGGRGKFNGGLNIGVDIKAGKGTVIVRWGDVRPPEEAPAKK